MSPRAASVALQGQQTRTAILDAALELFGERGYRGCSLAQIAERAGIGQSGLLFHFKSKEQLLSEVLHEHYPLSAARTDLHAIANGATTFGAEIERVTRANLANPALVRFFAVMTGESLTDGHPMHDFFVQRYERLRENFTDAVCSGLGVDGPGVRQRVGLLVTTAFAAMDGLQMQWLRDPEVDLAAGVRLIAETVEAQLAAWPTRTDRS
jgi:AcrR family transcriptional regulator